MTGKRLGELEIDESGDLEQARLLFRRPPLRRGGELDGVGVLRRDDF
jgi:hypothetical protein